MEKLFTESSSKLWEGKGKSKGGKENSKAEHLGKPLDLTINKQASLSNPKNMSRLNRISTSPILSTPSFSIGIQATVIGEPTTGMRASPCQKGS